MSDTFDDQPRPEEQEYPQFIKTATEKALGQSSPEEQECPRYRAAVEAYGKTLGQTVGAIMFHPRDAGSQGEPPYLRPIGSILEEYATDERAKTAAEAAFQAVWEAQPEARQIRATIEEFGTDKETAAALLALMEGLQVGREVGMELLHLAEWPIIEVESYSRVIAASALGLTPAPPQQAGKHTGPLPQPTFPEAKIPGIAMTDPEGWSSVRGELALIYEREGYTLSAKLTEPVLEPWGMEKNEQGLREIIKQTGMHGALLLFECLGRLMELPLERSQVHTMLDDLAQVLGFDQRSRAARLRSREQVWKLLLTLEQIEIHGVRSGTYHDKEGNILDLHSHDPLIRLTGQRREQETLDGSGAPVEVSFTYGAWAEKWRGDSRILTFLGDLRRLTQIPSGRPAGALAQRIGLALNQRWREKAARGKLRRVGEDPETGAKHLTFPAEFTRKELLEMYKGSVNIQSILNGHDPQRARRYWQAAIKILREHPPVIGHYAELDPAPKTGRGVSDWQSYWYEEQRLDIRPGRESTEAIAEINKTARSAQQARARKRKKKTE